MATERENSTHPSYGMISFSRISCGHSPKFFGSSLPVDNYIELKIVQGELRRDLSHDWFYGTRDRVVKARMTPAQFSEMITSMNMGQGVPCTLEEIKGENVQELDDFENRAEFHQRAFKNKMVEFGKTLKDSQKRAAELIAKKNLNKADQDELNWILGGAIQEITQNIPYFMETFQEGADKVIVEAKAEVEAAIMHKLTTLGIEKLDELKQIGNK